MKIITRTVPATDTEGTYIKAMTNVRGSSSLTVPFPYNVPDPHWFVAMRLATLLNPDTIDLRYMRNTQTYTIWETVTKES